MSPTLSLLKHSPSSLISPRFSKVDYRILSTKHKSELRFRSSKQESFGKLLYRESSELLFRIPMPELIRTSASRSSSDDDEAIQALEDESFIEGSAEFRPVGFAALSESTLNRLSKWFVSIVFGGVILLKHDPEALWAIIGSITNSMLSFALKRIFNQDRPFLTLRSDPGMPSSHAQSISYIAVFIVLSIVEWLGLNELSLPIIGITLTISSYLCYLRVSQKLHTVSQVLVGAVVGSVFSIFWSLSWNEFVLEAFTYSLLVQIGVFLGAAGFSLGFIVYAIRNWFKDE